METDDGPLVYIKAIQVFVVNNVGQSGTSISHLTTKTITPGVIYKEKQIG